MSIQHHDFTLNFFYCYIDPRLKHAAPMAIISDRPQRHKTSMNSALITKVLRAVTGAAPLAPAELTESQIDWLIETGFGPVLYAYLSNGSHANPPLRLHSADLTARVLSAGMRAAAQAIVGACAARGDRLTLLKGLDVATRYYPHAHWRLMRDIDLLVPAGALARTEATLRGLGYVQRSHLPASFYTGLHHSMPFHHPHNGVWVELHTALFPPANALGRDPLFAPNNIEAHSAAGDFYGHTAGYLRPELLLVYLAAHWGNSPGRIGGAVPLLDLALVLQRAGAAFDWSWLLAAVRGSPAANFLYLALSYLQRCGLIALPPSGLRALRTTRFGIGYVTTRLLHRVIERLVMDPRTPRGIVSESVLAIIWQTLSASRCALAKYTRLPWALAFPNHPDRFSPRYQWQRLRALWR